MAPDDKPLWQSFIRLCRQSDDPALLEELFRFFFTHEERENLSARFQLIQALLQGELTQREIASRYNISIAKITRGSNALKTVSPALKQYLLDEMT